MRKRVFARGARRVDKGEKCLRFSSSCAGLPRRACGFICRMWSFCARFTFAHFVQFFISFPGANEKKFFFFLLKERMKGRASVRFRAFWRDLVALLETAQAVFNISAQSYGARELYKNAFFCTGSGARTARAREACNFRARIVGNLVFHIPSEEIIQKIVFVVIPSDARRADGARPEYRRRRRCARGRSARGNCRQRGQNARRTHAHRTGASYKHGSRSGAVRSVKRRE